MYASGNTLEVNAYFSDVCQNVDKISGLTFDKLILEIPLSN